MSATLIETPSERCPFCGAADPAVPATGADHFCVLCDQCGCEGPKMATAEGAVVAWDARSCAEPARAFAMSTEQSAALGEALRLIDNLASEMNGAVYPHDSKDADDIAMDLADAFAVPFNEHWVSGVVEALFAPAGAA